MVPPTQRQRGNRRGAKKGPRKAAEPSDEFKTLKSQATLAYLSGDFEQAQELVEKAISLNPEIFSAYALLSSVHQAHGDNAKAVTVLFQGLHTRPRDTASWINVAHSILDIASASGNRSAAFDDAIYCYHRVIGIDRDNLQGRSGRAELYFESGRYQKAVSDYKHILRIHPHDLDTLRVLSECYTHIGNPAVAISLYDDAFALYRSQNDVQAPVSFWSDANIYAELHWVSEQYMQGLLKLKQLARWILGRGAETYWDDWTADDREFDGEDSPRRTQVQQYHPGNHDLTAYGFGLPLELRIKFGLFRLKLDFPPHEEAMQHFDWLDPAVVGDEDLIYDYPDLIREVAQALKEHRYYERAIWFYEQLQSALEPPDVKYFVDIGQCYRHLEMYHEAENRFWSAADLDEFDLQGLEELLKMFGSIGHADKAGAVRSELVLRQRQKKARAGEVEIGQRAAPADPDMPLTSVEGQGEDDVFNAQMLSRPVVNPTEAITHTNDGSATTPRKKFKDYDLLSHDLRSMFKTMSALDVGFQSGDRVKQLEWLENARAAIDHFRAYKLFWSAEKQHGFTGYSKHGRDRAVAVNVQSDHFVSESSHEPDHNAGVPDQYCQVKFTDWLDCFLRYALRVSRERNIDWDVQMAYDTCKSAATCIVWQQSRDCEFTIYVIWSMCAAQVNDHETLCNISRFFMKRFQFVTDAYRLYGALNRLCNSRNEHYNGSPAQKYTLRQIKAMDLCLMEGGESVPQLFDDRASLSTKDGNGNSITATKSDVALIVLYGHMLYAAQSYAYGIHYFYRAYELEPANPMILLSLALGYTHHLTKRQSENRQALLACGLSFLFRYYGVRRASLHPLQRQEAEYNVGRIFHFLGLIHLSIPYYERCTALSPRVQELDADEERAQDFGREAAFALRGFYAQAGQMTAARDVTREWLQL